MYSGTPVIYLRAVCKALNFNHINLHCVWWSVRGSNRLRWLGLGGPGEWPTKTKPTPCLKDLTGFRRGWLEYLLYFAVLEAAVNLASQPSGAWRLTHLCVGNTCQLSLLPPIDFLLVWLIDWKSVHLNILADVCSVVCDTWVIYR